MRPDSDEGILDDPAGALLRLQPSLCVMQPDALAGTLSIRCPRCKAMNILRPVRAPDRAPPERPTAKGPTP